MELDRTNICVGDIFIGKIYPILGSVCEEPGDRQIADLAACSVIFIQPVNRLRAACCLDFCGDDVGFSCCYRVLLCTLGVAVRIGRLGHHTVCHCCTAPQGPGKLLILVKVYFHLEADIFRLDIFRFGGLRLSGLRLGRLFFQLHLHIFPLDAAALVLTFVGLNVELDRTNICVGDIFIGKIYPILGSVCEEPGDRQIADLAACSVIFIQPVNRLRAACCLDFRGDDIGLACRYSIFLCAFGIAVTVGRLGQDAVFYLRPTPQGPGNLLPILKIDIQIECRALGGIPHIFKQHLLKSIVSRHGDRLFLSSAAFLQAHKLHIVHF